MISYIIPLFENNLCCTSRRPMPKSSNLNVYGEVIEIISCGCWCMCETIIEESV